MKPSSVRPARYVITCKATEVAKIITQARVKTLMLFR
jgi:hypothetical protein